MDLSKYDDHVQSVKNIPEGIGFAEDSGFASIGETVTTNIPDDQPFTNNPLICNDDIIFSDIPLADEQNNLNKKKRDHTKAEAKRQAEAEYDQEKKERHYKRLMHLLNKSKFYSNYIIQKVNVEEMQKKSKIVKNQKNSNDNDKSLDNHEPPLKRSKRIAKQSTKYNLKDYISDDVQKKVRRKMNLSQEEIAEELSAQSDNDDTESSTHTFVKPKYFDGELWKYQQEGLQWLKVLYENGLNGILADEMGLGKTVQVIALLCHLIEKRQPGPFLIIVPLSTLPNWLMEFEKFAPTIPIVTLYGNKEERTEALAKINLTMYAGKCGFKTRPVVLTTYEMPFRESKLRRYNWRYIIIDEGHRIKNHECQLVSVLKTFKSMNRLLLTGTPLQNNLAELWSLLNFLSPDIFDDLDVFQSWFNAKELQDNQGTERFLKQEQEKHVVSSLREILKPFMLRREKNDVNLNIPPKKEIIVYAPITKLQHDLYAATLNRDYDKMTKVEAQSVIVDDANGVRPKRKCLSRHKYSNVFSNPYQTLHDNSVISEISLNNDDDSRDYKSLYPNNEDDNKSRAVFKQLEIWKEYANITDRNRDFFIRLTVNNRLSMYKKIINHPYLVHCPLDDSGLPRIDEDLVEVSGKLLVLDAMLKKLYARGHKVLLFSTMTMLLDVIGDYLNLRPWKYLRLDGATNMEDRKKNITLFNTDPSIFLFLISTRAGGVGLNLAAADTVIMYDGDWNPQADLQAMARCHRIGQTRPVVIYRLCTKGTIDEAIMQTAETKRKLEKMVISKNALLNMGRPDTILQLKKLLESSESKIVTFENKVFTEAELDKLMDRSDLLMPNESRHGDTAETTKN